MPYADPIKRRTYQQEWRANRAKLGLCVECDQKAAPNRTRCVTCMGRRDKHTAARRAKMRETGLCVICGNNTFSAQLTCRPCIDRETDRQKRFRNAALDHYGRSCACCGEDNERFLCFDHVNNDGANHRKTYSGNLADWLAKNKYPVGFQTLCFNCNMGKQLNGGICPHQACSHTELLGKSRRKARSIRRAA